MRMASHNEAELAAAVVRELLSPFSKFLKDKTLYEVIVNRPGQVLTEGAGGWRTHDLPELSFEKLMRLARAVASFSNQSIDETHPILSATLPGDERIQIVSEALGGGGEAACVEL